MNNEELRNFNIIYEEKCGIKYLPSTLAPVDRIIVLGDIHGDFTMLIKLLRKAKVINNNNDWIGKDTVIVQVGDQIDSCRPNNRGDCLNPNYTKNDRAEDIKVLTFMTDLHNQAENVGGAVYSLVGNHELMNVDGDMTYVSYENLKEFGGEYGRQVAFKPGNKIANFLACTRKMALIIGCNLFVHAGFEQELVKKYKIDDINKLLTLYLLGELKEPNHFKEDFLIKNTSPLWTRTFGNTNMSIEECNSKMNTLKQVYKVGRIFVGHTPQMEKGINSICKNRIWRTDVGASNAFDGLDKKYIKGNGRTKYRNGQLLEIKNDKDIEIIS